MNIRTKVPVELGSRGYEIIIGDGLLEAAGELLAPVLGKRKRVVIVTDSAVAAAGHLKRLEEGLAKTGVSAGSVTVPSGEKSKSWPQLAEVCDQLLAMKVDRGTLLIALGGGVVGDLAGFAASIVMRGIDFVQVPTTLLSQVDSSVGGKTGINTVAGKNMVGSFYQPRMVLADLDCLATLSARELRSGYAEIAKHAAISDAPFFGWLEDNGGLVVTGDRDAQAVAIEHSCRTKAAIVAEDEREGGRRALLNFGHTFGHALEAETGFGEKLLHGEAVAVGMVQAMDLSVRLGLAPRSDASRLASHLRAVGLPFSTTVIQNAPFDEDRLLAHMAHDKKASDGRLTFVVSHGLGSAAVLNDVPADQVRPSLGI
ncbi:3-dehydroquinate synthase [Lacibacterium aquatile]|uniref:3-dehydroquinate synthase n=1 Tax=Lacibacterium aquatile TaxID=1168082 RepID=A0ABW5DLR7_9PROT